MLSIVLFFTVSTILFSRKSAIPLFTESSKIDFTPDIRKKQADPLKISNLQIRVKTGQS